MNHTPDRWISKAGLASRQDVRSWIESGRLLLNGRPVTIDRSVSSPESSPLRMVLPPFQLDGRPLTPPPPVLLGFNKPRGVVVTHHDPRGRSTVRDLLLNTPWGSERFGSVRPLGRLDQASAGLLLMTNYPELFSDFLDPESRTPRVYRVQVAPALRERDRDLFYSGRGGEEIGYGPIIVTSESQSLRKEWIRVGLTEGKNREIRTFLRWFGYQVIHLIRLSFGPFELLDLAPGKCMDLTDQAEKIGVRWIEWVRHRVAEDS